MATKMRGTRRMGHGPAKTSMRRGGSIRIKRGSGQVSTRALNGSLNRPITKPEDESAKPGIARSGNTVGTSVPSKVSTVQLS